MTTRALLLIDHGSRRDAANEALETLAQRIQAHLGTTWVVQHAHMELAPPSIEEGFTACVRAGAQEIVVYPFMLSPGRHVTEDVPKLVREAAAQHAVAFEITPPLGTHPAIAQLIADAVSDSVST